MRDRNPKISGPELRNLLLQVGLTETEAHLYIAGFGRNAVTVQELLAETKIKRPTIYHALGTLQEKGLVAEHAGVKSSFRMQAPGQLLGWIEQQRNEITQKEDAVQSLVQMLATRAPAEASSVQVVEYRDMKSVQATFDLAFYARSKQCVLVAPSQDFLAHFDPDGVRMKEAESRGVRMYVSITQGDAALLIYDDSVVMISDHSNATVLQSAALAQILATNLMK